MKTKFFAIINFLFIYLNFSLFSQQALVESTSSINWITRDFVSKMSLDTKAANIQLPSGKKKASSIVKTKMPQLIHTPLLSLYSDSNYTLSDEIVRENLSLNGTIYRRLSITRKTGRTTVRNSWKSLCKWTPTT